MSTIQDDGMAEEEEIVSLIQTEGSIRRYGEESNTAIRLVLDRHRASVDQFNLIKGRLNFALASVAPAHSNIGNTDELIRSYSHASLMSTLRLSMFSLVRESACVRRTLMLTHRHPALQSQALDLKKTLEKVVGVSFRLNEMNQSLESEWSALTEVQSTLVHTQADLLTRMNELRQQQAAKAAQQRPSNNQTYEEQRRLVFKTSFMAEAITSLLVSLQPSHFDEELVAILERASSAANVKLPKPN